MQNVSNSLSAFFAVGARVTLDVKLHDSPYGFSQLFSIDETTMLRFADMFEMQCLHALNVLRKAGKFDIMFYSDRSRLDGLSDTTVTPAMDLPWGAGIRYIVPQGCLALHGSMKWAFAAILDMSEYNNYEYSTERYEELMSFCLLCNKK